MKERAEGLPPGGIEVDLGMSTNLNPETARTATILAATLCSPIDMIGELCAPTAGNDAFDQLQAVPTK